MYGLVNKAIEGLVKEQFGDEAWERILERSGIGETAFISLDAYDDEVTYSLVSAASEVLGAPTDELLTAFGEYWTKYVGREGYGPMMDLESKKFGDFLEGLDSMHARIAMAMPELTPPSFSLVRPADDTYELHYRSTRAGLAPMVVGLLRGLLELKDLKGTVEWVGRDDEDQSDVFLVRAA